MWYLIIGLYVLGMVLTAGYAQTVLARVLNTDNVKIYKEDKGDPLGFIIGLVIWPVFLFVLRKMKQWSCDKGCCS